MKEKKASTKSPSAYSKFVAQNYQSVKQDGVPSAEIFSQLGKKWSGMSQSEKARYN